MRQNDTSGNRVQGTPTTSYTRLAKAELLAIIRGDEVNHPLSFEVCFREATIAAFWKSLVKAVAACTDSVKDGRIYTSEELEVYFGPWDVEVRHTYRWIEKAGGDTYMGIAEPYAELVEEFEIVGAHDFENHTTLPGTIYTLNEYYKKHENEILKHTNHDTH